MTITRLRDPNELVGATDRPLRLLIADDHAIIRKGLKDILRAVSDDVVLEEAADGAQALHRGLHEEWDIVILDVSMPRHNGMEVLVELMRAKPGLRVLMFSVHGELSFVQATLNAGAAGYLVKEAAPEELLHALRALLAGETYLSASLRGA